MNAYLSAVNQKLFFSKLLLKQGLSDQSASVHLLEALCQSSLYQLECGYRHYLREVATSYQVKSPETIYAVNDLSDALASINKHPAEANEMSALEKTPGSWLYQMLAAHQQLARLPQQQAKTAKASPIAVIQVEQSHESESLTLEALEGWQKAFTEMVDRHRELMVEC